MERSFLAGKADGNARGPGSAGAAYPVDIIFRLKGQGVVNDMTDAIDMNAPAGYIGGNQHPDLAVAEIFQGCDPALLGNFSREHGTADAVPFEMIREFFRFVAAVDKDHDPFQVKSRYHIIEQGVFFFCRGEVGSLIKRSLRLRRFWPADRGDCQKKQAYKSVKA